MAAGDLTTLDNAKAYLRLDATFSDDAVIARCVSAASAWLTSQIHGRDLTKQSQTDTFEWNIAQERKQSIRRFKLSRTPLVSIDATPASSAVTLDGVVLPPWVQTPGVPADSYAGWRINGDFLELIGWPFLGSDTWTFSAIIPSLTTSIRFVTVTYVGGYVTYDGDGVPSGVPGDVEQAVIEIAGEMLQRRSRLGLRSRSIGGEMVTYMVDTIPPNVQAVIQRYAGLWGIG